MISITLGLFLMLGLTSFLAAHLRANAAILKAAGLNQELRAVMTLMVRDIRRASYWGSPLFSNGAINGIGYGSTYSNPFATVNVATPGCILYAYDKNGNGVKTSDEEFGFLLNAGGIMMRTGVNATTFDCTTASTNALDNLSDTKTTTITALTFAETNSVPIYVNSTSGPNIKIRQIVITLTGQVKSDGQITQSLTETVKLQNDLFSPT